jgi:hypothetical protein
MSALRLQADGIRGGQEFDVPPVRPLFYSVRTETGPEAADDRRSACAGDFLIYLSANSRIFGSGKPVRLSSVSNVNANSRFLAPRHRQSVRPAARTLICAITKSPADSVEAFAPAAMYIFPAKVILPAVAWSANPL